jgi:hypothetical protein
MITPAPIESVSVVPATALRRSSLWAPYACPMSTELPLAIPMKNEIMKNTTGKNADAAASAPTPISRPR